MLDDGWWEKEQGLSEEGFSEEGLSEEQSPLNSPV